MSDFRLASLNKRKKSKHLLTVLAERVFQHSPKDKGKDEHRAHFKDNHLQNEVQINIPTSDQFFSSWRFGSNHTQYHQSN